VVNPDMIQKIVLWAVPVLFAITVHEVAHGWVAYRFGDKTAFMLGRLTLNPFKHIDLIGTILVPLILLILPTGFIFGWAKPVPINPRNFKHYRRDMALVALAGPVSNFIMAIIWAIISKIAIWLQMAHQIDTGPIVYMGQAGIFINLMLGLLNLFPLPPLDGGRVLSNILPGKASYYFDRLEPFGLLIILILLATGLLGDILGHLIYLSSNLIAALFGF
jgi:Zn-dependent protease